MTSIAIELPDSLFEALKEKAAQFGVPPETLVRANVEDLLRRTDEELTAAFEYVLRQHDKLVRR